MGKKTNEVMDRINPLSMKGRVYVKNRSGDTFLSCEKSYEDYQHVELHLMKALYDNYSGFDAIPNRTNIIFCCPWSPCKNCVERVIPEFLNDSDVLSRGIRVKFRFVDYYVKSVWVSYGLKVRPGGGENFYEDINSAQTAYLALMNNYGSDENVENVENGLKITYRRNVVIAPSAKSTKIVVNWTLDEIFGE